jgi:hypothetical protein
VKTPRANMNFHFHMQRSQNKGKAANAWYKTQSRSILVKCICLFTQQLRLLLSIQKRPILAKFRKEVDLHNWSLKHDL